jgi:hypothetical protein
MLEEQNGSSMHHFALWLLGESAPLGSDCQVIPLLIDMGRPDVGSLYKARQAGYAGDPSKLTDSYGFAINCLIKLIQAGLHECQIYAIDVCNG